MTTKTIPDLPSDGEKISFVPWRPHSKKSMLYDFLIGSGFGIQGYLLSSASEPSIFSALCATVAGVYAYRLWKTDSSAKRHNKMLKHMSESLTTKLNGTEQEVYSYVVMSEYYLSRKDVRAWLSTFIKSCEHTLILNESNTPEHKLSWTLPDSGNDILMATALSVIDAALKETMNAGRAILGFNELDGKRIYKRDHNNKIIGYEIKLEEIGSNKLTTTLIDYFSYNIDFFLKTWNHLAEIETNIDTSTRAFKSEIKTLVINEPGTWVLKDGGFLEIVKNNRSEYEVTLIADDLKTKGQTLKHQSLESINQTWAHLASNNVPV